jgi:multiple sugar transport system substrate-binding protein
MLKKTVACISIGVLVIFPACSPNNAGNETKPLPTESKTDRLSGSEPLTLKVWTGDNEEVFKETTADPIRKKYPNVTLVRVPLQDNPLDKLIAAGNPPDMIRATKNFMIFQVLPTKMELDLTPLIKKHNYDVERYDPELIKSIKGFGEQGQLYGLPTSKVGHSLLYNKQLFDKFAVLAPKDDMTWEEAIKLAGRMTRLENGVQYRGMDMQFYNMIASQLNLAVIDRSGKSNMSAWSRPAELFRQLYSIPGNNVPIAGTIAKVMEPFYKGTLAMVVINPSTMFAATKQYPALEWDMVTVPVYPEAPGVDPYTNYTFFGITSTSKYPDEAFKIIAHLNSDEVQAEMNRKGNPTVLKSTDIQKQYAADLPELKGKNVQAIFKHKQSDPYVSPYFDNSVDTLVRQKFNEIVDGKKDNNTILRELDEAVNKKVAELKASK